MESDLIIFVILLCLLLAGFIYFYGFWAAFAVLAGIALIFWVRIRFF